MALDWMKLLQGGVALGSELKTDLSDGKIDLNEVSGLMTSILKMLTDAGVNTGEVGQYLPVVLSIALLVAKKT